MTQITTDFIYFLRVVSFIIIMTDNELTYKIRGAIFNVYNGLGPGLLESVYEKALMYELHKQGLTAENQVHVPIYYNGQELGTDLRADIVVEDRVIIELKSVEELKDVHFKQLLTYLKLTGRHVGLLVNFNVANILEGIHRKVN